MGGCSLQNPGGMGNASGKSTQETSGCPKLNMLPGQIWKV